MKSTILDSIFGKMNVRRELQAELALSSDSKKCSSEKQVDSAHMACAANEGVLDLRDGLPQTRQRFIEWLIFQHEMVLRPVLALQALRRTVQPLQALRALGVDPHSIPPVSPATLELVSKLAIVGLPWLSSAYPARLKHLADAAPLLLCRGNPAILHKPAVAIVGARAATVYGRSVARELAREAARAGLVVISGLARGIDAEAHRGALDAGGETIAVLGCGLDRVYPAEHRGLSEEILARGAVLSELPLGAEPKRIHFPLRNRLISGLSHAVVVVEAREKSGSLITVSHALEQGVEVLVVPGPITSPTSAGSNRLLRDGAVPLLDVSDLLALFPSLAVASKKVARTDASTDEGVVTPAGKTTAAFTEIQKTILNELTLGALTADALGRKLGLSSEEIAQELVVLELEGRIATDRNGLLCCAAGR